MGKVPYNILDSMKDYLKPKNSGEWKSLAYKQLAYLPISFFSGSLYYSAYVHTIIGLSSLVRKPTNSHLKKMKEDYRLPQKPKDKFSVPAVTATSVLMGSLLYASPDMVTGFYDVMTSTDSTMQQYSLELTTAGVFYETTNVFYKMFSYLIPLLQQYDTSSKVKESLHPYFKNEMGDSMLSIQPVIMHAMKKDPKKALSMLIDEYFDKGIRPYEISSPVSEELTFQFLGDDPLASFVNSLIGVGMVKYRPYFFEKAVEVAIEEKDISALSLLALYDYKKNTSTNTFKEQVRLLRETNDISQRLLAKGTFTNVFTMGAGGDDPSHLTLVQKVSRDTKRLQEKYDLQQFLSSTKYVNAPIDIQVHDGIGVLSEIRMRNPTLYEKLKDDYSLYEEAYLIHGRIVDILEQSHFEFKPLDIEDKYLHNSLSLSKKYISSVHEAAELFDDLGENKPILDFHARNLFVADDTIVNIDIENKGSGSKIFDIVNLLYYTPDAVPAKTLDRYTNSILKTYQEEIQKEDDYLQALFLRGMGLRRDSYMRARKTPQGFSDMKNIRLVVETMGGVFASYAQNSYQKKIAREQLQITESLLKAI